MLERDSLAVIVAGSVLIPGRMPIQQLSDTWLGLSSETLTTSSPFDHSIRLMMTVEYACILFRMAGARNA